MKTELLLVVVCVVVMCCPCQTQLPPGIDPSKITLPEGYQTWCPKFPLLAFSAMPTCGVDPLDAIEGINTTPNPLQTITRNQFLDEYHRKTNREMHCVIEALSKPAACDGHRYKLFKYIACRRAEAFARGLCEMDGKLQEPVLDQLTHYAMQAGNKIGDNSVQCLDAMAKFNCGGRVKWPITRGKFDKAIALVEQDTAFSGQTRANVRCRPELLGKCHDTNAIQNATLRAMVEGGIKLQVCKKAAELAQKKVDVATKNQFCVGMGHSGGAPTVVERTKRPPNNKAVVMVTHVRLYVAAAVLCWMLAGSER